MWQFLLDSVALGEVFFSKYFGVSPYQYIHRWLHIYLHPRVAFVRQANGRILGTLKYGIACLEIGEHWKQKFPPPSVLPFVLKRAQHYVIVNFPDIKKKLRGLSPRANYTVRAAAAGRRSWCQLLRIEGCHVVSATDPHGR